MVAAHLLLAALAAAPPAPERPNALALENGAYLLTDGGSYGTRVGSWSAWCLADGSESCGWCSPQGKPTGLEFVWDLDATWNLDTLVVSTRQLQESGYPGITARTVELLVGDGGAFRKAGSFEISKNARQEFPLPKGTSAKQVKLVVAANHGNAEFTEIAEVELLGTRTGVVPPPKIAGDYLASYGPIRLAVEGDEVIGCYDWTEGATIEGTIVGRNARVTWTEYPNKKARTGTATFTISPDGQAIRGVWYEDGALQGEWSGPRAKAGEGPKCTPRHRTALETLKKQKRLVLYGIRFDSNSDVPRPESEATIAQVAEMMGQDPKLRLLVEGHTDSTNTDAYNLDLSQRRAQAVVAALAKRGVDAGRLKAQGFGRTRPVADNATAQGRALNRRVEVSITD